MLVGADDLGGERAAVIDGQLPPPSALFDDVVVGDDIAVAGDDEAASPAPGHMVLALRGEWARRLQAAERWKKR